MRKRLKWVMTLVMVLFFAVTIGKVTFAASSADIVVKGQSDVKPGDIATVTVSIKNNPGVLGATLKVDYDSNLTLTNAENGTAFSDLTMTKPGIFESGCKFVWDGLSTPASSDGAVLKLTFKVSDSAKAGASLPVKVTVTDMIDSKLNDITTTVTNGNVTVKESASTPEPEPEPDLEDIELEAPKWMTSKIWTIDNYIDMGWFSVENADGYYVYRSTNGGSYKKIKTTISSCFDDESVSNGNMYKYKIVAYAKVNGKIYTSPKSSAKEMFYLSKPKISSVKNIANKSMMVNWKKKNKASGYEIQYATKYSSSSGFSNSKTIKVNGYDKVNKKIKYLKKNKTYYVAIRAYRIANNKFYYSDWSSVKKIKITK